MDAAYDDGTVLSIFEIRDRGSRGPRQLTRRDRDFLRALYSSNPAQGAQMQRAAIRSGMARRASPERE